MILLSPNIKLIKQNNYVIFGTLILQYKERLKKEGLISLSNVSTLN